MPSVSRCLDLNISAFSLPPKQDLLPTKQQRHRLMAHPVLKKTGYDKEEEEEGKVASHIGLTTHRHKPTWTHGILTLYLELGTCDFLVF